MKTDPAPHTHTEGSDILSCHPYPRQAGQPLCPETKISQGINQHGLKPAQVEVHIPPVVIEVKNRVSYQLAGTVKGGVPAAAYSIYRSLFHPRQKMPLISTSAQGVNRGVLHKKQIVCLFSFAL